MTPAAASKARAQTRRARNRAMAVERKRLAAAAKAAAVEEKAEHGAPKVQREPVLGRNGEVLRGPRLEPDGITYVRSNPIKRLAALSRNKEFPTLGKAHVDAADRLLIAWEEAETINVGASNYGERSGGSVQTGMISDAVIAVVNAQIKARAEVETVHTFLGALWPAVHAVVIRGIAPSVWGKACGMDEKVAVGYAMASLDRLVEHYKPKERRTSIRSVAVGGFELEDPAVNQ